MEKEERDEGKKVWRRRREMKEGRYGRRRGKEGGGGAKGGAKEKRIYLNMYILYIV